MLYRNNVCKSGEATWYFDNTAWGPSNDEGSSNVETTTSAGEEDAMSLLATNDEDEDSGKHTTNVSLVASVLSFTLLGYYGFVRPGV